MSKTLALPAYVPTRFCAIRFRDPQTGKMRDAPVGEINTFVRKEILRFNNAAKKKKPSTAAAAAAAATTDNGSEPQKKKAKPTIYSDLRQTVAEVMQNIPSLAPGNCTPDNQRGTETPPLKDANAVVSLAEPNASNGQTELPIVCLEADEDEPSKHAGGKPFPIGEDDTDAEDDVDEQEDDDEDDIDNDNDDEDVDVDDKKKHKTKRKRADEKSEPVYKHKAAARIPMNRARQSNALALRNTDRQQRLRGKQFTQKDVDNFLRQSCARALPILQAPIVDLSYIHLSNEIAWNRFQIKMIEHISISVPMVAACMGTLQGQVVSEGIKFTRENVELIPSAEFENYTERYLVKFARQAIDAYFMIGLIPICYAIDPVTKQRYPYVPAIGTYLIKRHDVHGELRYRFYWINDQAYSGGWTQQMRESRDFRGPVWEGRLESDGCYEPRMDAIGGIYDPCVEIIHTGKDIQSNGMISSKLATLLATAYVRMREQKARVIGVSNSANPALVTEYDHAGEEKQSRNFQQGYFTSASGQNAEGADIRNMTYIRDTATKEALAGLFQTYESLTGDDAADRFGVEREEYTNDLGGTAVVKSRAKTADGVQAPWSNQYHVSSARRLANGPQAHVSSDYCNFMELLEDEVCNVMGVPRTYINGTSIKASGDLILNRFSDEVTDLKKLIGDVLTHAHRVIWLNQDVTEYMSSEFRLARQSAMRDSPTTQSPSQLALLTEDDLFETENNLKRIRAGFAKKPSENVEELKMMLGLGKITEDAFAAELARRNNFNPLELTDDGDPLPTEMRQMLIPEFGEYIKMKMQQEQAEQQMAFQEKQAKADQQFQREQLKSQERVAKKKATTSSS